MIVEGCGSISRQSKELANLAVWIEAPREVRRERWQKRDSGKFDEFWGLWQAQEDAFYEAEKSDQLADLVVLN